MIINSSSLTVPGQPSPWFHAEAWLPFRNCEMDYCALVHTLERRTFPDVIDYILLRQHMHLYLPWRNNPAR